LRQPATEPAARSPRRYWAELLLGFVCVFGGLALPTRGLGPYYVAAHVALGNALVEGKQLDSGVTLRFQATSDELASEPWHATLVVSPPGNLAPARVPIDVRVLSFLPTAAFIALALAVPLATRRKHAVVLTAGFVVLQLVLWLLMAAPLLSFLGGTGPITAFHLGRVSHVVLQLLYRALVVPPGMTFIVPLVVWASVATKLGGLPLPKFGDLNPVFGRR
jgi:hypothetical protein